MFAPQLAGARADSQRPASDRRRYRDSPARCAPLFRSPRASPARHPLPRSRRSPRSSPPPKCSAGLARRTRPRPRSPTQHPQPPTSPGPPHTATRPQPASASRRVSASIGCDSDRRCSSRVSSPGRAPQESDRVAPEAEATPAPQASPGVACPASADAQLVSTSPAGVPAAAASASASASSRRDVRTRRRAAHILHDRWRLPAEFPAPDRPVCDATAARSSTPLLPRRSGPLARQSQGSALQHSRRRSAIQGPTVGRCGVAGSVGPDWLAAITLRVP